MIDKASEQDEAARLFDIVKKAGGTAIETEVLQPAGALLDLYGEDIRGRAFTTSDPNAGEMMLRPDFTVPVVFRHLAENARPARYAYCGEVFRRQEDDPSRPREYLQVGYEVLGHLDLAEADAEVFALIASCLSKLSVRVVIGDIGLVSAAVNGLALSPARRSALLRHIWRPRRFRRLLQRFSAPAEPRSILTQSDPFLGRGPELGKRSRDEIVSRLERLRVDNDEPTLPNEQAELMEAILALNAPASDALAQLRDIAVDLPTLAPRVDMIEARFSALKARGIDVEGLPFEATLARGQMEYYDGFVFAFHAADRADLPPLASGGRYDALTAQIGKGAGCSAVGGVLRPHAIAQLREGL